MLLEIKGHDIVPKEALRGIMHLAFDTICDELKLRNVAATVELTFHKKLGIRGQGAVNSRERNPYKMVMEPNIPAELIAVLAHEMKHVCDIENNDLMTTEQFVQYKGERIPMAAIEFAANTMPTLMAHERAAYSLMWPLAETVFNRLPKPAQDHVLKSCPDILARYRREAAIYDGLCKRFE